ncbi:hypothetical protein M758_6G051200 [Ceratodon purpureus]|nr:hypothetical protein M758_6G051200 [Ceratodon purpureus]
MGEPNKGHDPEKGLLPDDPRPSLSEGITSVFSKAGEGITNAISKAGGGILDAGKKVGEGARGLVPHDDGQKKKKDRSQKKNPDRAKAEKKFHKGFKPIPREEPKDTNIVGNITKLLPANTFLMFQTLAPLATNDGNCGKPEIIMTSIMLIILASTCMLVCFTDTIQFNGKVYHGLVTWSGLWNPSFKGDPAFIDLRTYELKLAQFYADRRHYKADKRRAAQHGLPTPARPVEPMKPNGPHIMGSTYSSGNSQYELKFTDFLHAVLSAAAFATLTMLTNPVSTCFYPDIPSTVVKTLPLLVGFVISAIFAFSPPARNGIAHPLSPKVPSVTDNYKPPDPKGVVHGPQLPPKPPGKDDAVKPNNQKPDDDDDDDDSLTGSAKRIFGKLFSSSDHDDRSPPAHHAGYGPLEGMKSFTSGLFNKYEHELKEGAAKVVHNLGDEMKKEASHLLGRDGPGVTQSNKEFHLPTLAQIQEVAKSPGHAEALMAGLMSVAGAGHPASPGVTQSNTEFHMPTMAQIQEVAKSPHAEALMAGLMSVAGAGHPALAAAAHAAQSAYTQGAKDAVLQIHQDIKTATSAPLAGLSRQTSMALSRANSMLQSAGSSLSLPSIHDAHDALFHQAAQVLQQSGLVSPSPHGSEAATVALAAGKALMQAGFQPGGLSPQALALNAYGNLNLNAANALIKDAGSLALQGGKSLTDVQDELARQHSAFTQGLNAQLQTLYNPATSVAEGFTGFIHNGSQTLNQIQDQVAQQQAAISQGAFAANLASMVARETGTLLQEGADHGITGVQDELARQKAAVVQRVDTQVQSIAQPVSSLAQNVTSLAQQGSQAVGNVKDDMMKQKAVLTQELNTQVQALSTPATSVAQDIAALRTPGSQALTLTQAREAASQKLVDGLNSQFAASLAQGMARGMSMRMHAMTPVQEHISDVQQQFQSAYQPATSVAIDVATLLQQGSQMHTQLANQAQSAFSQGLNAGQFTQPMQTAQQVVETHLRRLASLPPQSPSQFTAAMFSAAQPAASVTINTLVDSRPVQQMAESSQSLGPIIEDVTDAASSGQRAVSQAFAAAPSFAQMRNASSEIMASTSDAAGQALATASARIWRERPESTEISDAISIEEITSESETEGRSDRFRAGPSSSMKKSL